MNLHRVLCIWHLESNEPTVIIQQVSFVYITQHTLTFNELGLIGRRIATEVNMGTLLQDERVFLVKRVTTWNKM